MCIRDSVDTGSPFNIITKNTWTKVIEKNKNLKPISFKERLDMKGVGGRLVLAEEIVYDDFTLNCYKSGVTKNFSGYFVIADIKTERALLGRAFLGWERYLVSIADQFIESDQRETRFYLIGEDQLSMELQNSSIDVQSLVTFSQDQEICHKSTSPSNIIKDQILQSISHLSTDQHERVFSLLGKHGEVFRERLGRCKTYQHSFELDTDKPIRAKKLYSLSKKQVEIARPIIQNWLDNGVVTISKSESRSPMTLQKKKNKYRLCSDFREVNKHLSSPAFEPPPIDNLKTLFGGSKFFTTLDFRESFLQIGLADEKSKDITTFVFEGIPLRFEVSPYGTKASTASFIAATSPILAPFSDFCRAYIDDVIIFSSSFDEHVAHVNKILEVILNSGMTLNLSKCQWFCKEVKYLGFVINEAGIAPNKEKVEEIIASKAPKTVKQVRSLLGLSLIHI